MSIFNRDFVQAFNPAYRQAAGDYSQMQQVKMQQALQAEQEKARRAQQLQDKYGAALVVKADGTPDVFASEVKLNQMNLALEKARKEQANRMELEAKASSLGVDPAKAGKPTNAPGWSVMAKEPAQIPGKPLEQMVAEADRGSRVKQAADESRARAEASAPYENRFSPGDRLAVNGKFVGQAVRDLRTGTYGIMGADGTIGPIPEGAEPVTPTSLQKNVMGPDSFKKLDDDLITSERALRQIERFFDSVGGMQNGIGSIADRMSAAAKTLASGKDAKLTPEEKARKLAQATQQALLGSNRTSIVGPGVMTEYDARRVLDAVGGDVGALMNPEVTKELLSYLYQDRYAQYERDINHFNAQVKDYYGERGFKERKFTPYNKDFGAPAENGSTKAPAAAPSGLTDAENARLNELRQKLGR